MLKTFRLLLLVLLAVVLPLRGALADVACCAGEPDALQQAMATGGHDHGAPDAHGHVHGHHDDARAAPADDGNAPADGCHGCTASCSATPILTATPVVRATPSVTETRFPALSAPAPSHPSEGLERPPRTV